MNIINNKTQVINGVNKTQVTSGDKDNSNKGNGDSNNHTRVINGGNSKILVTNGGNNKIQVINGDRDNKIVNGEINKNNGYLGKLTKLQKIHFKIKVNGGSQIKIKAKPIKEVTTSIMASSSPISTTSTISTIRASLTKVVSFDSYDRIVVE